MKKPTPDTTRVPTPIVVYLLHNLWEGLHGSGFRWQLAKVCVPQRQYPLKSDLQQEVKEVLESALGVSVSNTVSVCLRSSLAFPCLCSFPPKSTSCVQPLVGLYPKPVSHQARGRPLQVIPHLHLQGHFTNPRFSAD